MRKATFVNHTAVKAIDITGLRSHTAILPYNARIDKGEWISVEEPSRTF